MSRRRRQKLPTQPVRTNIHQLSYEGRGVTTIDGKTTFVFGALAEEQVDFIYTNRRSQFDEGQAIDIIQASDRRVAPKCQHFGVCGGCNQQHLQHQAQVAHKQQVLLSHLEKMAKASPQHILPAIVAEPWGYRNKARLGVRYVHKKASVLVGFRERNSAFLANIDQCEVLNKKIGYLITPLRRLLLSLNAYADIAQLEVAIGDEVAAIVVRHLVELTTDDREKLITFAKQHELQIYLQPSGPESINKLYPKDEIDWLSYRLPEFDLEFRFHPLDFTQVNPHINQHMVSLAMKLLDVSDSDNVLDLFCGLGNFSLPIARKANYVVGVEGDPQMTQRATMNAQHNQLSNTDFYMANLFDDVSNMAWAQQTFDKILLDPPRSGAETIVNNIEKFAAQRIVYVSCNHASLARDANILINQKNYRLTKAGIIDMFPHTAHFENIAVFDKEK